VTAARVSHVRAHTTTSCVCAYASPRTPSRRERPDRQGRGTGTRHVNTNSNIGSSTHARSSGAHASTWCICTQARGACMHPRANSMVCSPHALLRGWMILPYFVGRASGRALNACVRAQQLVTLCIASTSRLFSFSVGIVTSLNATESIPSNKDVCKKTHTHTPGGQPRTTPSRGARCPCCLHARSSRGAPHGRRCSGRHSDGPSCPRLVSVGATATTLYLTIHCSATLRFASMNLSALVHLESELSVSLIV
jgi:hypothetical protein